MLEFDKKRFSENVNRAFEECPYFLTKAELADCMEMTPQGFSNSFTSCRSVPSVSRVARLAQLLEASVDELLEGCLR